MTNSNGYDMTNAETNCGKIRVDNIAFVEVDSETKNRSLGFPDLFGRIVDSVIRSTNDRETSTNVNLGVDGNSN